MQKESVVGRKRLADQTREFKKLSEADKPDAFKSLLKDPSLDRPSHS